MKKGELYYQDIHIGTITETNWDMRSSGTIVYCFDFENESRKNNPLAEFIRFCIITSVFIDDGDMESWEMSGDIEREFYMEFVDSPDWFAIAENGKRVRILCPLFHDNNEITWQETKAGS